MSAMTAANTVTAALPGGAISEFEVPQRRFEVIEGTQRRSRPRLAYGVVALTGALAIVGAQMALSIITTQGSYELSTLSQQQRELTWQKQILSDGVAGLNSPQFLAANASALGMVIDESPSYLRLSDGAILGSGQAAAGASSVDAIGRGTVPNALITRTPLVTDPAATIQGAPAAPAAPPAGGAPVSNTPPPLTDGLPTPSTH